MKQLSLQLRMEGMEKAGAHAGADWREEAIRGLVDYARASSEPFLVEEVRQHLETRGLPVPPAGGAWGSVAKTAEKRGLIHQTGGFRIGLNASPKPLWKIA